MDIQAADDGVAAGRGRPRRPPARRAHAAGALAALVAVVAVVGLTQRDAAPGPATQRSVLTPGPVTSVPMLPGCGDPLGEVAADPAWTMAAALPSAMAPDSPLLSGDVLLQPVGDGAANVTHLRSALLLVDDGVVVSIAELGASGTELTTASDAPARVLLNGVLWRCADDSPLTAATYSVVPALGVTSGPVGADVTTWLLGAEQDLVITAPSWSEVGEDALPDLPFAGRLLIAQAHSDGHAWRVVTESHDDRATKESVRTTLEGAGYTLIAEETDPARTFWWAAHFDGEHDVVVEVSNETGGGFYVSWSIRER